VLGAEPEAPGPYGPAGGAGEELLAAARRHLVPSAEIRPGDVLLLRWRDGEPARHCAIATGPGRMVHAHAGAAVCEVALAPWWSRHLAGVFSFPGAA